MLCCYRFGYAVAMGGIDKLVEKEVFSLFGCQVGLFEDSEGWTGNVDEEKVRSGTDAKAAIVYSKGTVSVVGGDAKDLFRREGGRIQTGAFLEK